MILPTFKTEVYAKRREQLSKILRPNIDLILVFNRNPCVRNFDNMYPFRSDSNFVYLTGFFEENSALMIYRDNAKKNAPAKIKLFCQNRDPLKELWTGKITGPERAAKAFGVKECFDFNELTKHVKQFFAAVPNGAHPKLFTNALESKELKSIFEPNIEGFYYKLREGRMSLESLSNLNPIVRRQRLIKDTHEISLMKKCSKINVDSHLQLLKKLKPGLTEYQTQAIIEYEFRYRGATGPSYGTICAAGENATCLHYQPSQDILRKGDLFLIDAGCELDHYASDITRTYPIGGKFNRAQKSIMQIVGEAHLAAINVATAGTLYSKIHETAVEAIVEGLKLLGLLKGSKKDIIEKEKYKQFFPHSTGHWLGMDVHDPGPVFEEDSQSVKLKPGMIFTVEPGLYFQSYDKKAPNAYRGIGVRIEDDVLVTSKGPEIITKGLPRYAEEIEAFMNA